jgi:hypothetical protein
LRSAKELASLAAVGADARKLLGACIGGRL